MGRFSPDHDQRKGQWLYNALRPKGEPGKLVTMTQAKFNEYEAQITRRLFDMSSEEFDRIMELGNFYPKEEYCKHD